MTTSAPRAADVIKYPGWSMVFVGAVCMGITFGLPISTLPLIYGEVIREFGWTRTAATLAFTYKDMLAAVISLFIVAPFLEKLGLRVMMIMATLMTGTAMLSFLLINSLLTYNLAILAMGAGQAFTILGVKILVSRWFTRRQGLAIGLALTGTSVGGALFPLIFNMLSEGYGWRMAMAILSLGIWVFALPLYVLIARERPTEQEIAPEAVKAPPGSDAAQILKEAELGLTFRDILRMPMFWLACVAIAVIQSVDSALFQHTALFITHDVGLSAAVAAGVLSGTFALGLISKVFAGWVFDTFSMRGVQIWWVFIGLAILLAFAVNGMMTLILFAAARGIVHGGLVAESPIIAKHCFGPKLMNKVLPIFTGFLAVGGGLGPALLSACADHYGDYKVGFMVLIGLTVIAVIIIGFVRPLYRLKILELSRQPVAPPIGPAV